jgi:hypothetical protein
MILFWITKKKQWIGAMNNNERVIEVLRDGTWFKVRMSELKIGETLRMFEPDGSIVYGYDDESTKFVVAGAPYAVQSDTDSRGVVWHVETELLAEQK